MTLAHCFPFTGWISTHNSFQNSIEKTSKSGYDRPHPELVTSTEPRSLTQSKAIVTSLETAWKWQSKRWSFPFFLLNSGSIWYENIYKSISWAKKIIMHTIQDWNIAGAPSESTLDRNSPFTSSSCKKITIFCVTTSTEIVPIWVHFQVLYLQQHD